MEVEAGQHSKGLQTLFLENRATCTRPDHRTPPATINLGSMTTGPGTVCKHLVCLWRAVLASHTVDGSAQGAIVGIRTPVVVNQADRLQPAPDLVRIPANSTSRFSLEEFYFHDEQKRYCNSFLGSVGVNRDLIKTISKQGHKTTEDYQPPSSLRHCIPQSPALLAADLFQCLPQKDGIFTSEDKDPSVLWQIQGEKYLDIGTVYLRTTLNDGRSPIFLKMISFKDTVTSLITYYLETCYRKRTLSAVSTYPTPILPSSISVLRMHHRRFALKHWPEPKADAQATLRPNPRGLPPTPVNNQDIRASGI